MPEHQILQRQKAVGILSVLLRKEKIPHALLFTGLDGLGKGTAAVMFAMACNCMRFTERVERMTPDRLGDNDMDIHSVAFCDCKSCRKILSGNHPDIHKVAPSGTMIKIDRIRELCHSLSMKPYEAAVRVVIIEQAQTMNMESSNALLKILEEPPDRTIFILTAQDSGDLLPTIVSRCRNLRFYPVSQQTRAAIWREEYDISPEDALILAALTENGAGRPDAGRVDMSRPTERKEWILWRGWVLKYVSDIMILKGRNLSVNGLLAIAERLARKKVRIDAALSVIRSWLRDLIVYKHCPEKILNPDQLEIIQRISHQFSEKSLLAKIEAVDAAQQDLHKNANIRLTLEVLVLQLAKK